MPRSIHKAIVIAFSLVILSFNFSLNAQGLEWSKDTVSKSDAVASRNTYANYMRGGGQKATEKITVSVDKLKAIMDACYAKGIKEVSVLVTVIRNTDVARYRRANPTSTATDAQLIGSQILVFRVPRAAFAGMPKSGIKTSNTSLLFSLLGMGLVMVEGFDLPDSTDDVYFVIGTVCPPPASCD